MGYVSFREGRCVFFVWIKAASGNFPQTFLGNSPAGQFQRRPLYPNQKCLVVLARCGGLSCQDMPGGGTTKSHLLKTKTVSEAVVFQDLFG